MRKKKNKRVIFLFLGILLFLSGDILIFSTFIHSFYEEQENQKKVQEFFEFQEESPSISETSKKIEESSDGNYLGVLEIPKIHFKRGFYPLEDVNNTVEKNIQLIQFGNPNEEKSNILFAAHSGTGYKAFFKDLGQLELKDFVFLYYEKKKYTYEIVYIYEEDKNGYIDLQKDPSQTTLTLTTCKPHDKNKQLVLIANQIETEENEKGF